MAIQYLHIGGTLFGIYTWIQVREKSYYFFLRDNQLGSHIQWVVKLSLEVLRQQGHSRQCTIQNQKCSWSVEAWVGNAKNLYGKKSEGCYRNQGGCLDPKRSCSRFEKHRAKPTEGKATGGTYERMEWQVCSLRNPKTRMHWGLQTSHRQWN